MGGMAFVARGFRSGLLGISHIPAGCRIPGGGESPDRLKKRVSLGESPQIATTSLQTQAVCASLVPTWSEKTENHGIIGTINNI